MRSVFSRQGVLGIYKFCFPCPARHLSLIASPLLHPHSLPAPLPQVREAPEAVAIGIVENYNDFAAAMMHLDLIGIWNQRPLLAGGEITGDTTVLPNVPRGPEFRRVMEAQTRWLTSHPGGRRGALVEHLRSAFCYESSNS